MPTIHLTVHGMHCQSCTMRIEDVCKDVPGVKDCSVDLQSGRASITHDGSVEISRLKKEIEGLGEYTVKETL